MANDNAEKLFSAQDVVKMAAKLIGSQPQDLIEEIKENDLSTVESLSTFLKPFSVAKKNANKTALDENYNKGYRKGRKKSELEFIEVFQLEQTEGQTFDSLLMDGKQKLASKKDSKEDKVITASQAFNVKEVKAKLAAQDAEIQKLMGIQTEYSEYKSLQGIKGKAVGVLTEYGAAWSKDPSRRLMQEKAFEKALKSNPHRINSDGTITILDSDKETPLHNPLTGDNWDFKDWVKSKSPVDFIEKSTKKDKETFTPGTEKVKSNHDFSESQMKNFTAADFKREHDAGNFDKADFIKKKMYENHGAKEKN